MLILKKKKQRGDFNMAKKSEVEIIKSIFEAPILNPDIKKAMEEEMEGLDLAYDKAKILAGGGLLFEIPSENLDEYETVKEVEGVILDHHHINGYWKEKYTGASTPPDCGSIDGKYGEGNPGGDCKICPLNQFGSDEEARGKACKNMHRIYLLRSGEVLPILVTLPPTSIKNFSNYMAKRVITKGLRSFRVITRISLKKAQSQGGISYSQAQFKLVKPLDEKTAKDMEELSKHLKASTRRVDSIEDYTLEETNENNAINENNPKDGRNKNNEKTLI